MPLILPLEEECFFWRQEPEPGQMLCQYGWSGNFHRKVTSNMCCDAAIREEWEVFNAASLKICAIDLEFMESIGEKSKANS